MPYWELGQSAMHVIVVGGHTRGIGKTSVMAGLIRNVKPPGLGGWTAVKVTQYGHGVCSHDGQACGCEPEEHPFALTEERDAAGRGDTSRFLAAGAHRALWLRVRQGQLAQGIPVLRHALGGDEWVMIESNSILEFLAPDLYLMVVDAARRDFKESAQRFFHRADALVAIGVAAHESVWPNIRLTGASTKPVFHGDSFDYTSPELIEFVQRKLIAANPAPPLI